MNIFRILGDLSHLASIFVLLYVIVQNQSTIGLSLKTQILYVVVYVTRYFDLFLTFHSVYNLLFKVVFLALSIYTVYIMTQKYKMPIHMDVDTFPVRYLIAGAAVASIVFTLKYTVTELIWSFSIWLESIAIIPQLYMLQKTGEAENITTHYIATLGVYRALYIPNWIYRYITEGRFDYVSVFAGIVQTLIYSDFFYIYYNRVMKGKKFELPV